MSKTTCSVDDCSEKTVGRGQCMMHYQRQRAGRPLVLVLATAECPNCLATFAPQTKQQKYCTPECRNSRNARRSKGYDAPIPRIRNCDYCGAEFSRAGRRVKYCSDECATVVRSIRSHKRDYGLSETEYHALMTAQGGVCAVCSQAQPGGRKKVLSVDHDHATGKVRGLLCHACNVGIGHLKDDPALLRAAIDYLTHHAAAIEAVQS